MKKKFFLTTEDFKKIESKSLVSQKQLCDIVGGQRGYIQMVSKPYVNFAESTNPNRG